MKGTGTLVRLAEEFKRDYHSVYAKHRELIEARRSRQACGAFLPDDGLPFRVRALRIHAEFAGPALPA